MTISARAPQSPTGLDAPLTSYADLDALVDDVIGEIGEFLKGLQWAEDEIQQACARHPRQADRIWHSGLRLFTPTHDRMRYEVVYRSHCRELLERVAADEDTRPGTAAEICCALRDVSLISPTTHAATALYMRMWQAAGLPEIPEFAEALGHYEALQKSLIEDHEQFARRELAVAERQVGAIRCSGRHHGDEVSCVYATAPQLALEV